MPNVIFADSFDHYATADFLKGKYLSVGNSASIFAGGRNGTKCYRGANLFASNTVLYTSAIGNQATVYVEMAVKVNPIPGSDGPFITLLESGVTQCDLRMCPLGELRVTRNGTSLAVTSGLGMLTDVF